MRELKVNVEHITRVEGHGNIVINVREGTLQECRLEIVEAPRFFEAMLKGRKYIEVAHIVSRICGICSVGHTLASLRATEDALGIMPSEQTVRLRKLIKFGEVMQSHLLHIYFLAAPDFLGAGSVFPLVATHKKVVAQALRMRKLSNDLCDLIGGRTTHPCSMVPNGFTRLPTSEGLELMRQRMVEIVPDVDSMVELLSTLNIPDFRRETEYISLKHPEEYAFYEGTIYSSDGYTAQPRDYRQMTNEYIVDHSTAKHTKVSREPYMVGALARVNNNCELLSLKAKQAAGTLKLKIPCHNPFMITIAQAVEVVHVVEESINLIDQLLAEGIKEEKLEHTIKAGTGVGTVEVPRGILYHEYTYDGNGFLISANCIIPTGQNLANIEKDMEALVPTVLDKPREEIVLTLEMLVRAYDPCISCATHMLKVEFV